MKSIDIDQFKSDVIDAFMPGLPNGLHDLTNMYHSELSRLLDVHAPLKKRYITIRPAAPWYNDDIRDAKRKRRRLERSWRRSKDPTDRELYRNQCRMVADLLRSSRSDYYSQVITAHAGDQRKLFTTVSKLLHTSPVKGCYPSHASDKDLPDKFMDFFDSKVRLIRTDLDSHATTINTVPEIQLKTCSFESFEPITLHVFMDIIGSSARKSCDLDPIPGYLLNNCLIELAPVLTNIVNLSLLSAEIPDQLKLAVLKPLLKKPSLDHREFKNFRPISNLQFVSKSIERVAARQLIDYLDTNQLHEPFQSAYKRHHSSETALIRVHNDIMMAIDNNQSVILLLLDISAAFDTIDHALLLSRLKDRFGICGNALAWFSSYLSGRK
jgi:hypothetical protein